MRAVDEAPARRRTEAERQAEKRMTDQLMLWFALLSVLLMLVASCSG